MIALSILLFFTTTISLIHGMEMTDLSTKPIFIQKVTQQIREKNTLVCVGLDPDWKKIPTIFKGSIQNTAKKLLQVEKITLDFLIQIIDLTEPYACSYKLQNACYAQFPTLMSSVIQYINEKHSAMPIIIDGKFCDIQNTMLFYTHYYCNTLGADAITVVPYMGQDVVQPFLLDSLKTGIVIIQSSNPAGRLIQEAPILTASGNKTALWKAILIKITQWNKHNNLMAVISGNLTSNDYQWIREQAGQDFFILVPGVGAQDAEPKNFLPHLMNNEKSGVIVNASRSILYPYEATDTAWTEKVTTAILNLNNALNQIRIDKN